MKTTVCAIACAVALAGCGSLPSALPTPEASCPRPGPVAAWILEPEPDLLLKLSKIISFSGPESAAPKASLLPASSR